MSENPKQHTMKEPFELSQDDVLRRSYVELIIKSLKHCKNYTLDSITISPDDGKVIEHHLKEEALQAVLEKTSREDCVQLFKSRIKRLITSDKTEWDRVTALVVKRHKILTQEIIKEMHDLSLKFMKPKKTKVVH